MKYSEAFSSHKGKYSDKWSQYLEVYDLVLKEVTSPKSILEIGVQNGGSLEVWGELYPNAEKIVGLDIDSRCHDLVFANPNVSVVVGDSKDLSTLRKVTDISSKFDIIVDDGSHTSEDIIVNLIRFLPALKPGGLYVIEDLHASYWQSFGGSLFGSETAVSYLKRLIDLLNMSYWNQNFTQEDLLTFQDWRLTPEFISAISQIVELRFFDSIAVIRLTDESERDRRQIRISAGEDALVYREPKKLVGSELLAPREIRDPNSEHGLIKSQDYLRQRAQIESILNSRSWRWTYILRKIVSPFNRT